MGQGRIQHRRIARRMARISAASLGLCLTACVPQYTPPQQVQASNPSVSYRYRGDQELVQANQSAMGYCNQYRSTARTANIVETSDGSKTVTFECVSSPTVSVQRQPLNPNLNYTYRTDQELLADSQNADNYCMSNGAQRTMSTVATNADGTRTAMFQCTPQ